MKCLSLFFLLFFVSCANYVNSIHRQIDREEKSARSGPDDDMKQHYSEYKPKSRFNRADDKRPIKDPTTYSMNDGGPSSGQMKPSVKREYRPQRYKADDFKDDDLFEDSETISDACAIKKHSTFCFEENNITLGSESDLFNNFEDYNPNYSFMLNTNDIKKSLNIYMNNHILISERISELIDNEENLDKEKFQNIQTTQFSNENDIFVFH